MLKKLLLTSAAAAALSAAGTAARADNIVLNTWYAGTFSGTPSPLRGGGAGTNGPILPNPTTQAFAIGAPTAGGVLSATITLPHGGYLLVTDIQDSGDRFEMFVNGVGATAAAAGATGLIPGGQAAVGSFTSVPVPNGAEVGDDISAALSNADFSSGTFFLPAGVDTITGTFVGSIGFGSMDLIVEAAHVPEPASFALLGAGLVGLGVGLRRRRRPG